MRSILLLSALLPVLATAAPPVLELQGVFRSLAGEPIVGGEYDVRFSLHTAPGAEGDVEVWAEQAIGVSVVDGVLSFGLGAGAPLDPALFRDHAALWLEIKIASEPALPRAPLRSVAWAMHATTAGTALNLQCTGCVGAVAVAPDVLDAASHAYSATISDVTVTTVKDALDALKGKAEALAVQVAELGTSQGGAVTVLTAEVAEIESELSTVTGTVTALSGDLAAHAADPDAHHSSTSDGLSLTPAKVGIKGTDVALAPAGLALAPGAAGELTAEKLAKLVGGADVLADDLHTHAGAKSTSGGGCYTAYGTSSCGNGYTAQYTGTMAVPAAAIYQVGVALGDAMCMSGWTYVNSLPYINFGYADTSLDANSYARLDRGSKPCAVCCPTPSLTPGSTVGCSDTLNLGQSGYGASFNSHATPSQITIGYSGQSYHLSTLTYMVYNAGTWYSNQPVNFKLKFSDANGTQLALVSAKTIGDATSSYIEVVSTLDLDLPGGNYKVEVVQLDGTKWQIWAYNNLGQYYYRAYGCLKP